jgi:hypothetical protein
MDKSRNRNHLKAGRREAAEEATRDMLQRIRQEAEYRFDKCRIPNSE